MTNRTRQGRKRKEGGPHPVDIRVGARVKERRTELGISQEKLAEALGLTFQHERAANRISASRLYRMGMTLGVDVPFFFEGYHEAGPGSGFAEPPAAGFESDPLQRREAIELLDAFRAIGHAVERAKMLELGRLLNSLGRRKRVSTKRGGWRKQQKKSPAVASGAL